MKNKTIWLFASLAVLTGIAFYFAPKGPKDTHVDNFESEADLKNWDIKRITQEHSFELQDKIVFEGERAARFELRKGEHVSDGWRSELRDPWHAPMFETTWYQVAFFVPDDFPIAESNSCLFAQWHDQKDPGDGDRNPPIAIRLRGHGELVITSRSSATKIQNGVPGPEVILYSDKLFKRNEWNLFQLEVRWDYSSSGYVNIWRNGQRIVAYKGPIGYNDDKGPYVKIGVYCRETPEQPLVAYHDSFIRTQKPQLIKKDSQ